MSFDDFEFVSEAGQAALHLSRKDGCAGDADFIIAFLDSAAIVYEDFLDQIHSKSGFEWRTPSQLETRREIQETKKTERKIAK